MSSMTSDEHQVENEDVSRLLMIYFACIVMFAVSLCIVLYLIRSHYTKKMIQKLEAIRRECEQGRVYFVETQSGAQRIVPPPLSPPLTEQQVYYPVGQLLADEARRAAL